MSAALRAGVVGLGMMGRHHVRVLRELEGVELVGAADALGDRLDIAGDVPVVSSVAELIDIGIDLCVVAAPTQDHLELGRRLAEAGVHTLIEKPLASDVAGATELAETFERLGLVGCVGHVERSNPAVRALRQRLEAEELGELYQIATRRIGPFPDRVQDVGVVKDLATHDIDLTAWVSGQRFASVAASVAQRAGRQHEDLVAAVGSLEDGTVTNHLVNWLSPVKERQIMVIGTRGAYVANTLTADLYFHANGEVTTQWDDIARFRGVSEGDMIRYAIPKPEPLVVQAAAFRDAVLGEDAEIVPMKDGLHAVAVAEAVLESAATSRFVSLS